VDQLPSWAFERYLPLLDPNGALRQASEHGAYCSRARYDYAGTYTAPGHATLYTGVLPRVHGVVANEVWDGARSKVISVVDDNLHRVFGTNDQFASPLVLRAPTVADALESATAGRAVTVSISLKDRAAVLPAGQHPDAVFFYDSKRGAYTSSSSYPTGVPDWLTRFQTEHPLSAALGVWEPTDAEALAKLLGPDAAPGEGDFEGLGTTFPHDVRRSPEPLRAVRATPFAAKYLFAVAREAVRELALGRDAVPDLLMLSVSSTDYAGHVFGAESWEYADSLIRLDRELTAFVKELPEGTRVLVTSDHGSAPLPERSLARGHQSFRVRTKKVAAAVNQVLAGRFELAGPVVASYTEPFVYFSAEAKASASYPSLLEAVASEVGKTLGVAYVFPVRELIAGAGTTELETLARASVTDDAVAELFVVPSELSVVDPSQPGGTGTSHGSPWDYDRFVPVLFWGHGIAATAPVGDVPILSVAPTLSALLGIRPPATARAPALPGAPRIP
jgi:predicted AlkP superfamily pyrophosphatase or phosphodiesterase